MAYRKSIWRAVPCLLLGVALLTYAPRAQAQLTHVWSNAIGDAAGAGTDAIDTDAAGNVFVAGNFAGTITLGGPSLTSVGNLDIFLAKFDANGNHLWSQSFGGLGTDFANDIVIDSLGNIIVVGFTRNPIDFGGGALPIADGNEGFVAKFDTNGTHIWSRAYVGTNSQDVRGVAVDTANNVLLTGSFQSTVDFGGGAFSSAGSSDIFLVKLDPAGNHIWSRAFGSTAPDQGEAVAADSTGAVLLTGTFQGTLNFGVPLTSAGATDVFAAKFTSAGIDVWARSFGDTGGDAAIDVDTDAANAVILTGSFLGTVDFGLGPVASNGATDAFVMKIGATGTTLWAVALGSAGFEIPVALEVAADGSIEVTGEFDGPVDFGGGVITNAGDLDIFMVRLSTAGAHLHSFGIGGALFDGAEDLALSAGGRILLCGVFDGTVDFGGGPLTATGATHAFVVVFLAPGATVGGGGSGDSGGGCFIATAAYGSPMAEEIDVLRAFRDRYMLTNTLGAAFVDAYYHLSPPIADRIAESNGARAFVRITLAPVVTYTGWMLAAPLATIAGTLVLLAMTGGMAFRLRRRLRPAKA